MVEMSKAKMEKRPLPKRFYKRAAFDAMHDGYAITLDGSPIKTPARNILLSPTQALAEAIAAEWEAQAEFIDPDTMPLTRLLNITIDRIEADREGILAELRAYTDTDLLYYRAPDEALRLRQEEAFGPLLAWFYENHRATFNLTDGIMPIAQPPASLDKIAAVFAAANAATLASLAMMVPMLGSALLAIAAWQGGADIEQVLKMARLDEDFQAEKWGMDVDMAANWNAKCRDIRAAVSYTKLIHA